MVSDGFRIIRIRDGGYLVTELSTEQHMFNPPVFATDKIDTALEYIRRQLVKDPTK